MKKITSQNAVRSLEHEKKRMADNATWKNCWLASTCSPRWCMTRSMSNKMIQMMLMTKETLKRVSTTQYVSHECQTHQFKASLSGMIWLCHQRVKLMILAVTGVAQQTSQLKISCAKWVYSYLTCKERRILPFCHSATVSSLSRQIVPEYL